MTTTTVAAWLLTYLLHSTILLGAVLVISRCMNGRKLAVQESLFRAALVGGILTATLQLGFDIAPVTGALALEPGPPLQALDSVSLAPDHEPGALPVPGHASPPVDTWVIMLLSAWVAGSMLALLGVLRSVLDLRRLMLTRCFRPAGRLVETLASAMGLRSPVRLSTSKAVAVPFATGIRQPEICCPERVSELAREHQTGLFAHEMAHLARRDPAWQLVYRIGEAFFILQPLNRLVRRRLEEIAEHLTDERAAACTGDRIGLARCLVVVAHWGHSSSIGLPATAFAAGPRLDHRVRRLISGTTDRPVSRGWTVPIGIALLTAMVVTLPAVATSPARAGASMSSLLAVASGSLSSGGEAADTTTFTTKTWSTVDDRPADVPPPPDPPAPPCQSTAPPAPEAAPAPDPAPEPESPPAAPKPGAGSAEPSPPTTAEPPAPAARPAPQVPPIPPAEAKEAGSVPRRRAEVDLRVREASVLRERMSDESRARAEANARRHQERSQAQAERYRARAEEAARQQRRAESQREALSRQSSRNHAEALRMAREEAIAQRERVKELNEEAIALAREAAATGEQLTDEQREALSRRACELRAEAELRSRQSSEALRERARELAEEARARAEKAEAERHERESEPR